MSVDINCDLGESFGLFRYGADEEIMPFISSANVACGFHAGDAVVMRQTVARAKECGVAIGAHFGLPDLLGFGRRRLEVKPAQLKDYVTYQIGALVAFLKTAQVPLHHVKPHGALYMMALEDDALARAIVEASLEQDEKLMIYTIAGSATDVQARQLGMRSVAEFFADRGYFGDGRVKMFDWTIAEAGGTPEQIGRRVVRMLQEASVAAIDGGDARINAETVCVHSDTPDSPQIAQAIRQALAASRIAVAAPSVK